MNPLNRIYKTIPSVSNLESITIRGKEETASSLNIPTEEINSLWSGVEELYRTRLYPGISICVRYRGNAILNRTIGHFSGNGPDDAKTGRKILLRPEHPICLFSASKAITAILMHHLDERGDIHLLDPVARYIPEFAQKGKKNITLYHLLTHRAGIPRIQEDIEPEAGEW